jgi:tRNA modification GTPase
MLPDLQDTIVALSSAPGPGGRAIVRLSGPQAFAIAGTVSAPAPLPESPQRALYERYLLLPGLHSPLAVNLYLWPRPRTYTGQDLVEFHTLSCPPLLDLLIAQLLHHGARAAQPGEFTLRAFLAGKLDLTQVEAVLGMIEAGSRDELKQALAQLAGGMARPLQGLRDDLLDLLAEVEAGLDFAEEDLRFVEQTELLHRLARALAQVTLLQKQLTQRAVGHRPFRVVLVGRPNVGKSSLFNALAGASAALVSAVPGTTRDYLVHILKRGDVTIELVDTAGWQATNGAIERQAQDLGREQAENADLLLLCVQAGSTWSEAENALLAQPGPPAVAAVVTKCDLADVPAGAVATSAVTGEGLEQLRDFLAERAQAHFRPALAPSLSRCRHHVDALLGHLRQAHAAVLEEEPAEVLALELRGALDELGEMVGAIYTDDLLDRIFSRFCIGK